MSEGPIFPPVVSLVRKILFRSRICTLTAWLLCATAIAGASPNALSPEEQDAGWRLLFDGETFDGWTGLRGNPFPEDQWAIENKCLRTVPTSFPQDIATTEAFDDFELSFDWKVPPGGNSGVKYQLLDSVSGVADLYLERSVIAAAIGLISFLVVRSTRRGVGRFAGRGGRRAGVVVLAVLGVVFLATAVDTVRTHLWLYTKALGFEMQVLDDSGHPDGQIPTHKAGGLYDLIVPSREMAKPPSEFNEARIVVRGRHGEHWLNGVKVAEFEMESPDLAQRIAASKFAPLEGFGKKRETQIALQHHGEEAWFRNIKIRPL